MRSPISSVWESEGATGPWRPRTEIQTLAEQGSSFRKSSPRNRRPSCCKALINLAATRAADRSNKPGPNRERRQDGSRLAFSTRSLGCRPALVRAVHRQLDFAANDGERAPALTLLTVAGLRHLRSLDALR